MSINSGHIHIMAPWEETMKTINIFMVNNGFTPVIPEEHIPELADIDYRDIEGKSLRFFIIRKEGNSWTGIYEDGEKNAQKELAKFISEELACTVIWSIFSGATCNYLYTIFNNGEISEELARGDAYDYDEKGQLKYFEFYNEDIMVEFLKSKGIENPTLNYEEILKKISSKNIKKEDTIHIAYWKEKKEIKKEQEIPGLQEILRGTFEEEEEEEKQGFFQKMMGRLTQPIWGKLEQEMGKYLPQLQKAQEMSQLIKPLIEQGLKGDELRAHPYYQRLVELEREMSESMKNSPLYSEEMEGMLKHGMGFTSKLLKPYDPFEEAVKRINSADEISFVELANRGKQVIELSSGIPIDWSEKGIKRIDKAISWSGIPKELNERKFKLSIGSLIGEIIIKTTGGEWVKADTIENSSVRVKGLEINPFKWFEEKLSTGNKLFLYQEFAKIK